MDLDPRFDQSIDDVIYYVMSVYKSVLIYDLLYYDDGLHNAMMGVLISLQILTPSGIG